MSSILKSTKYKSTYSLEKEAKLKTEIKRSLSKPIISVPKPIIPSKSSVTSLVHPKGPLNTSSLMPIRNPSTNRVLRSSDNYLQIMYLVEKLISATIANPKEMLSFLLNNSYLNQKSMNKIEKYVLNLEGLDFSIDTLFKSIGKVRLSAVKAFFHEHHEFNFENDPLAKRVIPSRALKDSGVFQSRERVMSKNLFPLSNICILDALMLDKSPKASDPIYSLYESMKSVSKAFIGNLKLVEVNRLINNNLIKRTWFYTKQVHVVVDNKIKLETPYKHAEITTPQELEEFKLKIMYVEEEVIRTFLKRKKQDVPDYQFFPISRLTAAWYLNIHDQDLKLYMSFEKVHTSIVPYETLWTEKRASELILKEMRSRSKILRESLKDINERYKVLDPSGYLTNFVEVDRADISKWIDVFPSLSTGMYSANLPINGENYKIPLTETAITSLDETIFGFYENKNPKGDSMNMIRSGNRGIFYPKNILDMLGLEIYGTDSIISQLKSSVKTRVMRAI